MGVLIQQGEQRLFARAAEFLKHGVEAALLLRQEEEVDRQGHLLDGLGRAECWWPGVDLQQFFDLLPALGEQVCQA